MTTSIGTQRLVRPGRGAGSSGQSRAGISDRSYLRAAVAAVAVAGWGTLAPPSCAPAVTGSAVAGTAVAAPAAGGRPEDGACVASRDDDDAASASSATSSIAPTPARMPRHLLIRRLVAEARDGLVHPLADAVDHPDPLGRGQRLQQPTEIVQIGGAPFRAHSRRRTPPG